MGVVCVVRGVKGKGEGFLFPPLPPPSIFFFRSRHNFWVAFLPHLLPARSLTLVPRSFPRNRTETLATQASDFLAACAERTWFGYPVYRIFMILNSIMEVKSVRTFPLILVKLATPPLPSHPKQSWILSKWVEIIAGVEGGGGGVGGLQHEPKADQKIVFSSRVLRKNYMAKGFFAQSQILLSSIVVIRLTD